MPIRQAQPSDAPAVAAAHLASWQQAYRGLLPDDLLDTLSIERRQAYWQRTLDAGSDTVLVYEAEGRVAGFVCFGPSRDPDAGDASGEIYAIYLDPAAWSHGYGAALMDAALERLRASGCVAVSLWVLHGNRRAIRFYGLAGFAPDGAQKTEHIQNGVELHELRYRRRL